ncbi:TetR/AcrR family transcriptional regulator [Methylohalomonas lacus]|nr:TetR/AcrR family transcriptional regulator [Methylohalomonas lacus]
MAAMTAGRPNSYEIERVIDQATQVFWRQGYQATSIADLLDATQLSRSSLYQAFSNKENLFSRCLQNYCDDLAAQLRQQLADAETGRAFIETTFMQVARGADDPQLRLGCLAMNTAIELGHEDTALAQQAHAGLQQFADIFTAAIRRGQSEQVIAATLDADALGYYLVSGMCGLRTLLKCGAGRSRAEGVARQVLAALD